MQQTGDRHPVISLKLVEVKRFDDAGIVQGGGHLGGSGREFGDQTLLQAGYFQKIAAIVGPHGKGLDLDVRNQVAGGGRKNHFPDSGFASGNGNFYTGLKNAEGGDAHDSDTPAPTGTFVAAIFDLVSLTRLAAFSRESNVPASVHHPSR